MTSAKVRVLLVGNHQMLMEALAAGLSAESDMWILGRCRCDDRQIVEIVTRLRPDVITLDVEPLGREAGEFVRRIRESCPSVRVVVLTAVADPAVAVAVARSGADAWLGLDVSLDRVSAVLRGVHDGRAFYPEVLLGTVLRELREDVRRARMSDEPLAILSARERDVLARMMQGMTGTEIAREMFLSANTVRTHSRRILAKLNVHSRLQAVALARTHGLHARPGVRSGTGTAPHLV